MKSIVKTSPGCNRRESSIGGTICRRLLPVAVLMPLIFACAELIIRRLELIDECSATIYLVIYCALTFTVLLFFSARSIDRIESEKRNNEIALRKREEVRLRELADNAIESARFKSDFLAKMSHEIRTPLNAVLGMTEILRTTRLDTEQKQYIDTIISSSEGLLTVINDVLNLSKIEAGMVCIEAIPFDVEELAESVVESFTQVAWRKNIFLSSLIEPSIQSRRLGDPARIRQILSNLLSNSIKFTEKGEISLEIFPETTTDGKPLLRFSVSDTGIGIESESLKHIGKPFMQAEPSTARQYGGTGLGLSISKRLVELMGGQLRIESAVGKGTTVSFDLHVAIDESITDPQSPSALLFCRKFLLVGPYSHLQRSVARYLCDWNGDVKRCETAAEAVNELLRQSWLGQGYTDAILMMPSDPNDTFVLFDAKSKHKELAKLRLSCVSSSPALDKRIRALTPSSMRFYRCPFKRRHLFDLVTDQYPVREIGGVKRAEAKNILSKKKCEGTCAHDESLSSGKKILLVEDNLVNQKLACLQLSKLGFTVDTAGNGVEALAALTKNEYELILLDCQMPVMDGFETVAEIRKNEAVTGSRRKHVVAITANAIEGDKEKCLGAGMDDYISKPVTMKRLKEVLQRYIEPNPQFADAQLPSTTLETRSRKANLPREAKALAPIA